ncbi:hypothetical protein SLS64_010347 [Diaporthe eres]
MAWFCATGEESPFLSDGNAAGGVEVAEAFTSVSVLYNDALDWPYSIDVVAAWDPVSESEGGRFTGSTIEFVFPGAMLDEVPFEEVPLEEEVLFEEEDLFEEDELFEEEGEIGSFNNEVERLEDVEDGPVEDDVV